MHPKRDSACCIDLKSKDGSLPDQSTLGSDAPPSEVRMQKLINDRYRSDGETFGGMTISKDSGVPK
jgi:hypothetical protein